MYVSDFVTAMASVVPGAVLIQLEVPAESASLDRLIEWSAEINAHGALHMPAATQVMDVGSCSGTGLVRSVTCLTSGRKASSPADRRKEVHSQRPQRSWKIAPLSMGQKPGSFATLNLLLSSHCSSLCTVRL